MTDLELATELREIAAHPYAEARGDQLRDLADAIIESSRLSPATPYGARLLPEPAGAPRTGRAERWCEVDLFAAFAPQDTFIVDSTGPSAGQKKPRMSGRAKATISSVLVFAPILTTWIGLREATNAYGAALDAEGPEVARRPFLEMWQQGFDGRLPSLYKFDNVALATLSVIFILIAWTIFENLTRTRHEDRSEEEFARLRTRLRGALTEATLVLGQVRLSSPARFTAELTKAAMEIEKVGFTTRKMHNELSKGLTQALESAEKVSEALVAGATDVQGAVEALDKHLTDINAACVDMTASVRQTTTVIDATGSKAEQALAAAGDHVSTTVSATTLAIQEAVSNELAQWARAVQDAISTLDTRVAGLDSHVAALDTRVGTLGTRAGELVNAATRIEAAIDEARATVSSSTAKAAELFGQQMTDTLSITASEFRDTFGGTSMEIREALGDWSLIAGAHASRIEIASDASGRTITVLERTRDTLDRLPIALDGVITNLPSKIKELTDGEFAELKYAIAHLESAVNHAAEVLSTPAPSPISHVPTAPPGVLDGSNDASSRAWGVPDQASDLPGGTR
ncbi:hypothetical protein DQ384_04455 [Sphaerisporangium album]|uniref:Uncharacterized protein n=1 Tax=Sphaerisporangium album TaxID=509200 RepID=A0A367FT27_9ACTN|nr:hypothetical protein [Sphaerisporangium album]RCG32735.1 hypothetical protein DQ384_04455 [Sphaerisporangium album]